MVPYSARHGRRDGNTKRWWIIALIITLTLLLVGGIYRTWLAPNPGEEAANQLQFDDSVTSEEQQTIKKAVQDQRKTYGGTINVGVTTSTETAQASSVLSVYVPVTAFYSTRQSISQNELSSIDVYIPENTDDIVKNALAQTLGLNSDELIPLTASVSEISDTAIAFVPPSELNTNIKLLTFGDKYYLDNFTSGGVFRQAGFTGEDASSLNNLAINTLPGKDQTLKVNMSGVTALTRGMINKLAAVGNANYFSEKIGPFLADADITHVSNEVSFQAGCAYSYSVFCSPPEMIEALKSSGVDLVEITGNHNNDVGSQYNTDTINQYHDLGWGTFGGGLNAEEAAKPYVTDKKGNKVAFLGYNFADAPGSGAIASADKAGANGWEAEKVRSDIAAAKQQADFVIVDIQYWECYSYPDGYIEYPECDSPIGQQASTFRQAADFGADMVIGSSAHQPQTYEIYNEVPIYYGLGNLYFDQTQWPGTERGIILTHYFQDGKLVQTKLTPTVYDNAYQTQVMNNEDAAYLLDRLKNAR